MGYIHFNKQCLWDGREQDGGDSVVLRAESMWVPAALAMPRKRKGKALALLQLTLPFLSSVTAAHRSPQLSLAWECQMPVSAGCRWAPNFVQPHHCCIRSCLRRGKGPQECPPGVSLVVESPSESTAVFGALLESLVRGNHHAMVVRPTVITLDAIKSWTLLWLIMQIALKLKWIKFWIGLWSVKLQWLPDWEPWKRALESLQDVSSAQLKDKEVLSRKVLFLENLVWRNNLRCLNFR